MTFPFSLEDQTAYLAWRHRKLQDYLTTIQKLIIPIKNPYKLTDKEHHQLVDTCRKTNFVIYQIEKDVLVDKPALQALAAQLGLRQLDHNLGASEEGITALQVTQSNRAQVYIPYTNRALNWHTDGYYNTIAQQVQAILMHCTRPSLTGGENQFLDHEIAYIQLRDENSDYIQALMDQEVMTIPANTEAGTQLRPAQTGPVFLINAQSMCLHMRYTARTRNIVWKQHSSVQAALTYLASLLKDHHSPYGFKHRLTANQGVLCNNVLHNRARFTDGTDLSQQRLLYRLRFYDRIQNTASAV